jgi:acetolactate synthase-1/2/3 large subunit
VLLSDYVIRFLAENGIRDLFLVSGGAIMHLLDAVGRNSDLRYYCNYHEQACVASAEGYARIRNAVGACLVTGGPGTANAISALPAAWVDSVPLMVICGNVRQELIADPSKLRQIGPQETNLLAMARPVAKYVRSVRDPESIRYELEYAYALAGSGRPGPVLLEIPLDVQGAQIVPERLRAYQAPPNGQDQRELAAQAAQVIQSVRAAKRPILVVGNGIHRAHALGLLRSLLDVLCIPVVLPVTGKDLLEEDHPMNIGVFGTAGQRRANFAIQNSDCLLAIGAGLNMVKIGFDVKGFAPKALKIIVDIDEGQLKYQVVRPHQGVLADAAEFLGEMLNQLRCSPYAAPARWLSACASWKSRYPLIVPEYLSDPAHVNSYVFWDRLADLIDPATTIVTGNALDTTSYFQAYRVPRGQRTINSGWGSMGWCLPLAIGACIGQGLRPLVCVTGDGSFQFNSHELLTISRYRLPIRVFVLNNQGYSNIRATQETFFEGRYVGSDCASGVMNPDFCQLAAAYGLAYFRIENNDALESGIGKALAGPAPALIEVNLSPEQRIFPKASAFRRPDGSFESRPLEDMAPFLPREEVWENMHQFDRDED